MPKNKEIEENDDKILTPEQQALNYLKANKENHYNFEEDSFIKIPSSSLILNGALGGGLCFEVLTDLLESIAEAKLHALLIL